MKSVLPATPENLGVFVRGDVKRHKNVIQTRRIVYEQRSTGF
jgi:hypothetical protein